jgi:hypothetical protein
MKWVEQFSQVGQLLKRSLARRNKSAFILQQNKQTVSKAEDTMSRYDQLKKSIKK